MTAGEASESVHRWQVLGIANANGWNRRAKSTRLKIFGVEYWVDVQDLSTTLRCELLMKGLYHRVGRVWRIILEPIRHDQQQVNIASQRVSRRPKWSKPLVSLNLRRLKSLTDIPRTLLDDHNLRPLLH